MMKVYAVCDKKAKQIVSIFASGNDETAKRSFLMLLTGPKNIFTDFPEDFALFPVCDLIFTGNLTVSRQDVDVLNSSGFKVDTFQVFDPVDDGSNYDKRYLSLVHKDRYLDESEEVFSDGK